MILIQLEVQHEPTIYVYITPAHLSMLKQKEDGTVYRYSELDQSFKFFGRMTGAELKVAD